jgi:predicted nucleic acid-binding Zn ribbon protein
VTGPGADAEPPPRGDAAREALTRARAAARDAAGGPPPSTPPRRGTGRPRATTTGRDPLLLGQALEQLVDEQGWRANASVAGVLGRWREIVGEEVAAHVAPETFDLESGTLVVRADSTAWATVIRMQVATLAARIAEEVGAGVVRTVRVVGPGAPRWSHGPRSVKGRGPRDTYG